MQNWSLDDTQENPLHSQLAQRIQNEIHSGGLKAGERIPSEREIMRLAQVSRSTVRHAIEQLVQQNLLERIQGKGTFVRPFKIETSLQLLYSFAEQFRAQGYELEDELLSWEQIPASPILSHQLDQQPGAPILCLHRLRRVEDKPIMLSIAYLPYDLCPGLPRMMEGKHSLYRVLTDEYDIPIVQATDTLEAIPADEETAELLHVPVGMAIMYVKRIAYTNDHIPVHIGYNYIRGDVCRFRSDMQAQPTSIELKTIAGLR